MIRKVYVVKFRGGVVARVCANSQAEVRTLIEGCSLGPDVDDIESICLDNTDLFLNFKESTDGE